MDNHNTTATAESPVKAVREKLGFTQAQMADKLGCSLSSERRFEYDGTLPTTAAVRANLRKLAKQAGIEIEA